MTDPETPRDGAPTTDPKAFYDGVIRSAAGIARAMGGLPVVSPSWLERLNPINPLSNQ